ncbi:MAG: YifB family Mg chelatase-like AAA ATPase [Clostridiales Family XIII bacterium]|jgi:magnesium chelatase family protein|nr:YifB family Mg chelatase-like AAA ATPase [Clostridiales Family XIII bacterium]
MTATLCGFGTELIRVETDITQGLPQLSIVGLPDMTVRESKERVRSALMSAGHNFPLRRITVNLSPADTKKEGSHFDLPIAVGILIASDVIDPTQAAGSAFLGELSLDGALNRAEYGVALVLGLKEKGVKSMFIPEDNMDEMIHIDEVSFFPARALEQVIAHLSGEKSIVPAVFHADEDFGAAGERSGCGSDAGGTGAEGRRGRDPSALCGDFSEVRGQERAKRAFQICAAGRHDLALYGPPGSGKSMLASRLPSILPPLTREEVLEVAKVYNIAGKNPYDGRAVCGRPFRAPHHSVTATALVGGGNRPRPGELSLAHRGVLFLDELPEFGRHALEMLRQPLEDRYIDLSRVGHRSRYPCEFLLVAAMNPCPCGYYGDPLQECRCTEYQRRRYASRVSGPLLDRIDLHVHVGRVEYVDMNDDAPLGSSTSDLYEGVIRAYAAQRERLTPFTYNGDLSPKDTERCCALDSDAERILKVAYTAYGFSARQSRKMQRVARTIADIEGSAEILPAHITEAISYRRPKDILGEGEA